MDAKVIEYSIHSKYLNKNLAILQIKVCVLAFGFKDKMVYQEFTVMQFLFMNFPVSDFSRK